MAKVLFALSLTIYEIFEKQNKMPKFDHENEGQDKGRDIRDLHRATGNDLEF